MLERRDSGSSELFRGAGPGSGGGPRAVEDALLIVLGERGIEPGRVAAVAAAIAGLDFPGDERDHEEHLRRMFPGAEIVVVNDAVAALDAGTAQAQALAIVCGAGLNVVARGESGLTTVPALGWPSGDWGGGDELGREAVRAAARAEDGRGPATVLRARVLRATGMVDSTALARAIRDGHVSPERVASLAGEVAHAASDGDAVARALMDRAVVETVALADAVCRRAWPSGVPCGTPVVLAGGLFSDAGFRSRVVDALRDRGLRPEPLAFRPVDGMVELVRRHRADDRNPAHEPRPGRTPS